MSLHRATLVLAALCGVVDAGDTCLKYEQFSNGDCTGDVVATAYRIVPDAPGAPCQAWAGYSVNDGHCIGGVYEEIVFLSDNCSGVGLPLSVLGGCMAGVRATCLDSLAECQQVDACFTVKVYTSDDCTGRPVILYLSAVDLEKPCFEAPLEFASLSDLQCANGTLRGNYYYGAGCAGQKHNVSLGPNECQASTTAQCVPDCSAPPEPAKSPSTPSQENSEDTGLPENEPAPEREPVPTSFDFEQTGGAQRAAASHSFALAGLLALAVTPTIWAPDV